MNSFEDELRRALDAEASMVDVQPDALPAIRRRIAARRPFGGLMLALGTGAAAFATVVAVFVSSGSCGPRRSTPPPIAGPTGSTAPSPSTVPAPPEITGAPATAPPPAPGSVYVYYLGLDRGRPRLYRETHAVPVGDGSTAAKVRAAVTEMLAGRPYDPDYRSGWPAGATVRDVLTLGGEVIVDLSGAGANNVGSEFAQAAVQQLVWTASAQIPGNPSVRILLDGARVSQLWGHVAAAAPIRRAAAVDTLGLVWVIDPQQGAIVGRTVTVFVAGIVFEATVQVRIKRDGTVVHQQFYTLDKGPPDQGTIRFTITLAPGTYTIDAYAESAADGSEQHLDNHQFTVR